jgi:hypothetical protein
LANIIKEAKKTYYNKKILKSNNKSKTTWNIIKEISGHNHQKIDIQDIKIEHKHVTDPKEIACIFNNYFTVKNNKGNKDETESRQENTEPKKYYTNTNGIQHVPYLVLKTFSTKEISTIIKSIKSKNSRGYDEISTKVLKISSNYIVSPVTYICNKIISLGIFPDRLKFSVVKPVYKKGDRRNCSNYRPISLLTSFSKVFEKAIHSRLTEHLANNKLLAVNQYGFRKGLTTENAIFELINEIYNSLNNKMKMGSVFCDLQKAFDTVNHEILLNKLQYYGIKGKAKTLLESYLQNRYQRVEISSQYSNSKTLSDWTQITQGVPQGSILGPLLFLIYINDLPTIIQPTANLIMFADDTSIFTRTYDTIQLQNYLNSAIREINKWFLNNQITLNLDKTCFIEFINKDIGNSEIQIKIGRKNINTSNEIKFLGLIIDNKLSWKGHIEYITPKLNSACYCIRAVKPFVSQDTLKIIYYSYFHAVMVYGLPFWGTSTDSIKVFKLQKKAIRVMMGCKRSQSCRELFIKLKILPLPSQYIFSLLMFLNKNKDQFTINSQIHHYATRQQSDFHQPTANRAKYQKGTGYMGVKVFNRLPINIKKEIDNPKKFRHILKNFLKEKSFYSLQEYFELENIQVT